MKHLLQTESHRPTGNNVMTQVINILALADKVNEMIASVRNGAASKYHTFTINEDTDDEEDVTIRVSDHNANPQRVSGKTIIFVIPVAECDERDFNSAFHIAKKSFQSVAGQYILDEDNCVADDTSSQYGDDVETILDWELN